jgi:hypothetical protein
MARELSPALQARTRAVTLLGQAETHLSAGRLHEATRAARELQALETVYGLVALYDGLPRLLDRYSTVLTAVRELGSE